jgi:DNA-binding response OmpR family regulator
MPDDKKTRILIIDDDIGFRELLRIHLSGAGYEVQIAEDGVTGGRALLAQAPDLIVSDVNMPFLDGFELLSLLRSDTSTASIPVILLSGRGDSDSIAKAVELGAADFLTKPVTRDQLLDSVQACLKRSRGRTKPPDYGSTPPV